MASSPADPRLKFLDGGGRMAELIGARDWSATALGPPALWPDALKMAVGTCLSSRFPMVVWWGPELLMLYNDAWQPILGETKHPQGLGRPGQESWPETWPIVGAQFQRALEGVASWSEDLLLASDRRGFIEECYFTYSHSPLRDASGAVVGVLSAVSETTARVLSERRLRVVQRLSEIALDAGSAAVSANATCAAMTSVLAGDNPDIPFALVYLRDRRGDALELVCAVGIDRGDARVPARVTLEDGDDAWGIGRCCRELAPIESEDAGDALGKLPGGVWPEPTRSIVALPINRSGGQALPSGVLVCGLNSRLSLDRKYREFLHLAAAQVATALAHVRLQEGEARLRELNQSLERAVDERTAELAAANRKLMSQIEERARVEETLGQMQRLEAVGQLTSGVAHDFNNLLTVVLGNVDFLERQEEDVGRQRRLAMVREAAERGANLTAQLLAFSRRQRLTPKAIDLNATVESMLELLRSTLGGTVRLQTALASGLWTALADPTQVELVILNLALNGRDAVAGGGDVTIETANVTVRRSPRHPGEPEPGAYVVIRVRDSGAGMAPDTAERAFEPFFTTKPVGKGSGLGLAQVYGFAKQSGGGVAIDTAVGRGTCITVFLPRALAAVEVAAPRAEEPQAEVDRRTILIVDDDAAVRRTEADMVARLGYEVLEAGSGGAALDMLDRAVNVDAAVIDFAMPGMNGAEVARLISLRRPVLPILFVTGHGDLDELRHIEEERILRKPFRADDLARKLRRAIFAERDEAQASA
ncbi:MAG TPA: response regulator [Caulobacteraceae bacterium]|nr:response regulator [Caulobacteraceae bacterium]